MTSYALSDYSHICFTVFRSGLAEVADAVRRTLDGPEMTVPFAETTGRLDVSRIYVGAPQAGSRHRRRVVLYAPAAVHDSTVMFTNLADGWHTLAIRVSLLVDGLAYSFAVSNGDEWPLYRLEVLESGRLVRHVAASRDVDRWEFWQDGEPLPQENVACYERARIKDRVTRTYLVELAAQLGFPIASQYFWESRTEAVYFEESRAK